MKRRIRLALALIGVSVIALIVVVYFIEPSVNYSLQPYVYQKIDSYWYTATDYPKSSPLINGTFTTVQCKNTGLFDATFNIVVRIEGNATFSQNDFQPTEFVDSHTVKLSYVLHSQERSYTDLYFSIGSPPRFDISIELQSNQLFLRQIESNRGGQSRFMYGDLGENNTLKPPTIS